MLRPVTDADFQQEVRESMDPIVVLFTGPFCQPCKKFIPVVEHVSKQFQGDVAFVVADMEDNVKVLSELNIRTVPSLVLFSDGMVREVKTGTCSPNDLRLWVQENV